ncbi:MAG: PDDEXK nuclease domain-containing protein [Defluviitaleaceae bacterium]|nr:PDDEXK nuclease domain-containing protein [Defluviitaleaceae bacterium]
MDDKLYFEVLESIKRELQNAQSKAVISANEHMITAYYNTGKMLIEKDSWGSKFIEKLAKDLKVSFPNVKGYSATNLRYMKKFASTYIDFEIFPHAVGKLAWRSNRMLLDKLKNNEERLWYAKKAIENNWNSTVLEHQIATKLIDRQGDNVKKVTNYLEKLGDGFSERVQEIFKDPYLFDFMTYTDGIIESEVENILITHITKLLMELGKGFAFVGRQYPLSVGAREFKVDLLFYNLELRCYVVIELKTRQFEPEHTGKLGFYISAVNRTLKKETDNPTIGILLTRGKDNLVAEVALSQTDAPIGVADYKYLQEIPEYLSKIMPSIEEIERRLIDEKINNAQ